MPLRRLKLRISSSLRFRLTLMLTLLIAFLTIVFASLYINHEHHSFRSELEIKGNLLADFLAGSIRTPLYAGSNEEVARLSAEIFAYGDIHSLKVFDTRNELVIHAVKSGTKSDGDGLTLARKLFSSSDLQYAPEKLLLGETSPAQMIGRFELKLDTSQLQKFTRDMILASSLLALIFCIATITLTFILLRKITATFQLLMSGVRNIEAGDLTTRLPANEADEPGRALAAINSLAETLHKRNAENERLQAEIVKSLSLQIDEEKNRNMAKLIQTNRMTSLGLLVSSMAHEINNPNSAIRLAAGILERGWKDILPLLQEAAEQQGEFKICGMPYTDAIEDIDNAVDAISRSSIRIERVVDNLRSYSLGGRENRQIAFDLNRVAENGVAIVRAHGNMAGTVIKTGLSATLPAIRGNPFQVEQVVLNLLMNAIQAMAASDKKIITLSTACVADGVVELIVKDSGPGISPEILERIFEPFFSTRIEQGGSGLGLYISRFLIEEQDGQLEICNDDSGGCRAVIRLKTAKSLKPDPSLFLPASC